MSPDVFFVVFRPWIGLALGGIRALRRIAVGISPFVGEFERPRRFWRASRAVGGILSAARMPRRRGVGVVRAVVYDFHVWLRERVDRVAMLERIQTHLFSALFCALGVDDVSRVILLKPEGRALFRFWFCGILDKRKIATCDVLICVLFNSIHDYF
jgi:hypothetical protein